MHLFHSPDVLSNYPFILIGQVRHREHYKLETYRMYRIIMRKKAAAIKATLNILFSIILATLLIGFTSLVLIKSPATHSLTAK